MSHPNRSTRNPKPGRNPFPHEIRAAREAAGLTQTEAAQLIYRSLRWWQAIEASKEDVDMWRPMDPALWEYWRLLIGSPSVQRARQELISSNR